MNDYDYPLHQEEHIVHSIPLLKNKKNTPKKSIIHWKSEHKDFPTDLNKDYLIMTRKDHKIFSGFVPRNQNGNDIFQHDDSDWYFNWSDVYWAMEDDIRTK